MSTYDYGNARVAALRGRLLDGAALRNLGDVDSPAGLLVQLERLDDWRPIVRQFGSLVDPRSAIELAIELHRSTRLGSLPRLYEQPARALVEALVMPLDLERALEVLRRRRAGQPSETVAASVSPGALLDGLLLAALARAPTAAQALLLLGRFGVISRADARSMATGFEHDPEWAGLEAKLVAASRAAREGRARGPGLDAESVRAVIAAERAEADAVSAELERANAVAATELERTRTLARHDRIAARAHRNPLGVGPVAGYVSAVEAQAIRLRAILARVAAGWSRERAGSWLAVQGA